MDNATYAPSDKIIVTYPDGETAEAVVALVAPARPGRPEGLYYTDGCAQCGRGLLHRLGMGGTRIA
jgi:hypothetical protein